MNSARRMGLLALKRWPQERGTGMTKTTGYVAPVGRDWRGPSPPPGNPQDPLHSYPGDQPAGGATPLNAAQASNAAAAHSRGTPPGSMELARPLQYAHGGRVTVAGNPPLVPPTSTRHTVGRPAGPTPRPAGTAQ